MLMLEYQQHMVSICKIKIKLCNDLAVPFAILNFDNVFHFCSQEIYMYSAIHGCRYTGHVIIEQFLKEHCYTRTKPKT